MELRSSLRDDCVPTPTPRTAHRPSTTVGVSASIPSSVTVSDRTSLLAEAAVVVEGDQPRGPSTRFSGISSFPFFLAAVTYTGEMLKQVPSRIALESAQDIVPTPDTVSAVTSSTTTASSHPCLVLPKTLEIPSLQYHHKIRYSLVQSTLRNWGYNSPLKKRTRNICWINNSAADWPIFLTFYSVVVSVSTSRSRDVPTSHLKKNCQRLGLGQLRLVPKTNFRPNCAGHINKTYAVWTVRRVLNAGGYEALTFSYQISTLYKSCYYHIRELRCLRPYLDFKTASTIATSIVHSKLDYCNSLPQSQIKKNSRTCRSLLLVLSPERQNLTLFL